MNHATQPIAVIGWCAAAGTQHAATLTHTDPYPILCRESIAASEMTVQLDSLVCPRRLRRAALLRLDKALTLVPLSPRPCITGRTGRTPWRQHVSYDSDD